MRALPPVRRALLGAAAVLAALVLLDAGLTLHNVAPTFAVRWPGELSIDLAVIVLLLALHGAWRGRLRRGGPWALTGLLALMVLARYIDITAPAVFGRPIDLYWDLPQVPDVAAMAAAALPAWQVAAIAAAALALVAVLVLVIRWCVGVLDAACARPRPRWALAGMAAAVIAIFAAGTASHRLAWEHRFALSVSGVLATQATLLADAWLPMGAHAADRADPLPQAELGALGGGDVYLFFLESYGAFAAAADDGTIAAARAEWAEALAATGRTAVSATVDSPTYGGLSWLAHGSTLAGMTVTTNTEYHRLLKSGRETVVDRFRAAGYRTVALLPGLRDIWPEGAALRFDSLYDAAALAYPGPAFGWWEIPDQYALDKLWREELAPAGRPPVFAFFASITSHYPFVPVPPYVADWDSLAGPRPYGDAVPEEQADGDTLEAYRSAIAYDLRLMAGFVRHRLPKDAVLIVLGDHQPPAVVGGHQGTPAVPVHVVAAGEDLLRPFAAAGFVPGLEPQGPAAGPMAILAPLILRAFAGHPGS